MEAKMISQFFDSVTSFFTDGDHLPWCNPDIIQGIEKEVAEATNGASDELKSECVMRLSWALVHSRQPKDVQRGIAMLEASLADCNSPLQKRKKMYLLAVGYYRSGNYGRSRDFGEQCLEIALDWRQALSLKKTIEDNITKGNIPIFPSFMDLIISSQKTNFSFLDSDGVIGIGITAATVGVIAGGIAAAFARRS